MRLLNPSQPGSLSNDSLLRTVFGLSSAPPGATTSATNSPKTRTVIGERRSVRVTARPSWCSGKEPRPGACRTYFHSLRGALGCEGHAEGRRGRVARGNEID